MNGISPDLASATFFDPESVADPNVDRGLAYSTGGRVRRMALVTTGIAVGGTGSDGSVGPPPGLADLCVREMLTRGLPRRRLPRASASARDRWPGLSALRAGRTRGGWGTAG